MESRNPLRDRVRKLNAEKEQNYSKKKLMETINKRMKTTMIGALDSFEKAFGHLWGHGLHESELTEEQKEFRKIWEETRAEVLDKGNNQLRASMGELANYTMQWNRYRMEFVVDK